MDIIGGTDHTSPSATDLRPARGYSWAQFEPGHEVSITHGAYSPRRIGERAEIVRTQVLAELPALALDPELALLLALYCQATARVELAHQAIEDGNLSPRLIEAASTATRVAAELGDRLGVGPLAAANLREVRSRAALNLSTIASQAPSVLRAITTALASIGLADRAEEFAAALAAALAVEDES